MTQINRFGNSIIYSFLESRLHPDMALVRDVVSRHKIVRKWFARMFFFPFFIKGMNILDFAIKEFY